jgi:hypothetical protein
MNNDITLSRKQVLQLAELAAKFPDTEWFAIETDSSSGIGTAILVRFDMFKNISGQDTTVNITDYSTW